MTEYKPKYSGWSKTDEYEQKISSYKVVFYDMSGHEIEIPERVMSQAYSEIDQAIYDWEINE